MGKAKNPPPVLTDKIQRSRLDCFIFFFTISFGWGKFRKDRTPNGKFKSTVLEPPPVCGMRVLGYPSRNAVWRAVRRVRDICPELVELYREEFVVYKEAARRFTASSKERLWFEYINHKEYKEWNEKAGRLHRKVGLLYRTALDRRRHNADNVFKNGYYKYSYYELLDRKFEHKRALREMRQSSAKLESLKQEIFSIMGVPEEFRRLSLEVQNYGNRKIRQSNTARRLSDNVDGRKTV